MLRRDSQDSAQRMDGKAAVTENQAARSIRPTCRLHLPKALRGNSNYETKMVGGLRRDLCEGVFLFALGDQERHGAMRLSHWLARP